MHLKKKTVGLCMLKIFTCVELLTRTVLSEHHFLVFVVLTVKVAK